MGDAVIDLEFDDLVVLKLFQQIVCNQEVADRFVAFFSQHRHKFVGASLDGEQKLEYTAVFDEYSALYDEILGAAPAPRLAASTMRLAGDVVKETGCSTEEIADRCRGAMGKKGGAARGGVGLRTSTCPRPRKLARLDRENRRIRRGRPAKKKPSALRAQALYAKGLAKPFAHNVAPLTGLRSATAPDGHARRARRRRGSCRSGRGTRGCPSSRAGAAAGRQHAARAELPRRPDGRRRLRAAPAPAGRGREHGALGRPALGRPPSGASRPDGARAPPTLAVVCNPPTLVWRDGRERAGGPSLVARSWAWGADADGHRAGSPRRRRERAIEQRLPRGSRRRGVWATRRPTRTGAAGARRGAGSTGGRSWDSTARRSPSSFADGGENGSVGMEARAAGDRVEAEAHPATFDGHRRRGSTTATRGAFYRSPLAALRLKALFDVEPHGDDARGKYGVALQAYVKPKGPSAWMVRAVVDAGGGGGGAPGPGPWRRATARSTAAPSPTAGSSDGDPWRRTARATRPERRPRRPRRRGAPSSEPPPLRGDAARPSVATIAAAGDERPALGQYCDLPVPKAHRHVYGDTLHQGARFSVPRKVVFDKPRRRRRPRRRWTRP
ncbi:hypothetical protein JL720_16693 [Aureococcus anophagefferens]|nr:hypothetical protein JL720_16693 [Aureococcus anophagefferens]